MISEIVPESLAGERLDRFLSLLLSCSRSQSAALIKQGAVLVNDAVMTTRSRSLSYGDRVTVTAEPDRKDQPPEADSSVEIDVVFADDDLVVVNKAAGLVVHPGSGNQAGTLVNGLLARFPEIAGVGGPHRPGIVHRLDAGTSGLLLVARTGLAYDELVAALAARRISRNYFTVCWGVVDSDEGLIDAPIARSPRDPLKMALVADGREARTRYTVVGRAEDPDVTALACELDTGRTHQIRVHLSAIGHPVVGDVRYGGAKARLAFDRPALHAHSLSLSHPLTGQPLFFEAPIPKDLVELLNRANLHL